jgi:transposase
MKNFLLYCNEYPKPNNVIIIDNASIYYYLSIADVIRAREYFIRYLFPYSPDFNFIEFIFKILKIWIRRRFYEIWLIYEGSFGDFLLIAIMNSHCDRFNEAHFRHNNNGNYVFEGDIEAFVR